MDGRRRGLIVEGAGNIPYDKLDAKGKRLFKNLPSEPFAVCYFPEWPLYVLRDGACVRFRHEYYFQYNPSSGIVRRVIRYDQTANTPLPKIDEISLSKRDQFIDMVTTGDLFLLYECQERTRAIEEQYSDLSHV